MSAFEPGVTSSARRRRALQSLYAQPLPRVARIEKTLDRPGNATEVTEESGPTILVPEHPAVGPEPPAGFVVRAAKHESSHLRSHPQCPIEATRFSWSPTQNPEGSTVARQHATIVRIALNLLPNVGWHIIRTHSPGKMTVPLDLQEPDEVEVAVTSPASAGVIPKTRQKPYLIARRHVRQVGRAGTWSVAVRERLEFRIRVCSIVTNLFGQVICEGNRPSLP